MDKLRREENPNANEFTMFDYYAAHAPQNPTASAHKGDATLDEIIDEEVNWRMAYAKAMTKDRKNWIEVQ